MATSAIFDFQPGTTPLLVSMPHVGTQVPDDIGAIMTPAAGQLPDTDWYVDKLYDFLPGMGVSILRANYSRYVVDLNRPPSGESLYPGQTVTGLCPTTLFTGEDIYRPGCTPDGDEIARRIEHYWTPYHQQIQQTLAHLRSRFGYAILWDAHSIKSEVPAFFTGTLPDFNWGTADGKSCSGSLGEALIAAVHAKYSRVINGRFKGGFITREYGDPGRGIHAVQLELSQATYMSDQARFQYDDDKAARVKALLQSLIEIVLSHRPKVVET